MLNNSQDIDHVVIYFAISRLLSFALKCTHENYWSVNTKNTKILKWEKKTPELKKNIQMFLL